MFQTLANAWKIADLRKKILFTMFIILIFRIGSAITVPFVDPDLVRQATQNVSGAMSYLTLLSGGGFSDASLFSLSITPYINASIIIQLLTVALPPLERWAKDGEAGRKKLGQLTRYMTVALGLALGVMYYFMIRNNYDALVKSAEKGFGAWFAGITIVLCFTAGSALIMWLGEQINEKGIGNGISMLLFAGIISRGPSALKFLFVDMFYTAGIKQISNGGLRNVILAPVILILFIVIIGFIVFITDAERQIPVQYAKRVVGRKMYGGQSTHIPIKVNMSGVMPIILATSIISVPTILATFFGWDNAFIRAFSQSSPIYLALMFVLIIAFGFFYVTIQYNPVEMANNLRRNSGAIPGFRPGKPTSDFIKRILFRVTFIGSLALGIIAVFPGLFGIIAGSSYTGLTLGGTSVMIVVGVALETTQQIESQMMLRHHKGFLE